MESRRKANGRIYKKKNSSVSELYHHGILGQKWGIRRYQNPDGTRTAAGKKRYSGENSRSQNKKMSAGKKVAIGVGVGFGAAAVAAGAAYAMKKSNMSTKALFESSVAKEFSGIADTVKNQTANSNARDEALKAVIGNHAKPLEAVRAIRRNPLDSARVMSDMDWNHIKPYLDSSTSEYNFVFNTMKYFGKFG